MKLMIALIVDKMSIEKLLFQKKFFSRLKATNDLEHLMKNESMAAAMIG
jgi:hypothetical protein